MNRFAAVLLLASCIGPLPVRRPLVLPGEFYVEPDEATEREVSPGGRGLVRCDVDATVRFESGDAVLQIPAGLERWEISWHRHTALIFQADRDPGICRLVIE